MINQLNRKLRSPRGASITYALLIFLVCTVVGSVVLAAGAAAAGRLSKVAEMDQRYYSVTSAADLLAKKLNGKTVTITRTREETSATTVSYKLVDVPDPSDSSIVLYTITEQNPTTPVPVVTAKYTTTIYDGTNNYAVDDISTVSVKSDGTESNPGASIKNPSTKTFLTECALDLMYLNDESRSNANTKGAMDCSFQMSAKKTGSFALEHTDSPTGVAADDLNIDGKYTLMPDGTLILTLSNADPGGSKNVYSLEMILSPDIEEIKKKSSTGPTVTSASPVTGYEWAEQTTTTETTTITSKITWKVNSITKKVVS